MKDGVLPDFLLIKGPLLGVMQGYFNLQITTINNQINDVVEVNNYGWLFKWCYNEGLLTQQAFDAFSCDRQVWCGKLEKFLSLQKRNCLLQPHASNARCVSEP